MSSALEPGFDERHRRHGEAGTAAGDADDGGSRTRKPMPRIRFLLYEARRIASDYSKAIGAELRHGRANERSISSRIRALLRARARYGIGPLYYSLYQLWNVPESEWPHYITDDPAFKARLEGMSPREVLRIAQNKALMYEHCVAHGLATVPVLCIVGRSPDALAGRAPLVRSLEDWRRTMRGAPPELFVKSIDGTYGEGAFVVRPVTGALEFDSRRGSLDDLYQHLRGLLHSETGWIVQPRLRSHPGLAAIVSPHGLATVRVLTAMVAGEPKLLFAAFKITVRDNTTDNFSKGKSGNLLAPVDCTNGRLGGAWGSRSTDWPAMAPFPVHPDSGGRIDGVVLPCWDELVELARRAQASLPRFRSIGWDIAIGADGPVLLEANATYDMSVLQIAHQRGLRRELEEALRAPARN